jgi:quercetin dioxygenase-like cupin family protein
MNSAIGKSMSIPRRTFLKTAGAFLALSGILRAQTGTPATQEQKFNMLIQRIGSQPSVKAPAEYFTGTARIDPLFDAHPPARMSGGSVTFEPGARNAWHTHPLGQVLIITAGCGWVQREGGPVEEVHPGDIVRIAPNEKHWHGATPATSMTHIAIQEEVDGKVTNWMEKVCDDQYRR